MTTELLNETTAPEENQTETQEETGNEQADLKAELEQLLRFKREHVAEDNLTACPACTTLVQVTLNQCPFCESSIAANNALVRESLRRLGEIETALNIEHTQHSELHQQPDQLSFGARIKRFFSSSPAVEEPNNPVIAPDGPRFLDRVRDGDALIVLERQGPWYKVKTRDSKIGWVYSTMVEEE